MTTKNRSRFLSISTNAFRQLVVSVINMAIPVLVIFYTSKEVWGAFVSWLLFTLIALQVANWGNKEFLLRKFSMEPNEIRRDYSTVLLQRLPLLGLAGLIALVCFPGMPGFYIVLWLLGRYWSQSTEVLVIFEKRFNASLVIEAVAALFFFGLLAYFRTTLNPALLLALYSGYQFAKGLAFFLLFRKFFSIGSLKTGHGYFVSAFPFFLLSVLGFLVSKADLYIVEYYLDAAKTAEYQVINSLLVFVMTASAFIYTPFTKNIYRNSAQVVRKARVLVMVSGIMLVPIALVCIHFILYWYLALKPPPVFYVLCFMYVFPSFVYGIRVVEMFRHRQEKKVISYLFYSAAANIAFSALFLYLDYGILGALSGGAMAQLLACWLFCRPRN